MKMKVQPRMLRRMYQVVSNAEVEIGTFLLCRSSDLRGERDSFGGDGDDAIAGGRTGEVV